MTIKEKTIALIDQLKATCSTFGMGNDGNEYKIIAPKIRSTKLDISVIIVDFFIIYLKFSKIKPKI